jgi:hypothetical protein
VPERKLPFRQKSEYPPAIARFALWHLFAPASLLEEVEALYSKRHGRAGRNSKLPDSGTGETISNIKFFNVQNKSLGIRLFREFENSNLEFQNSKIEGFRSDTS